MKRTTTETPKRAVATMSEVARHAGLSIATVSHVLNNSRYVAPPTRERVERAVAELGYQLNPVGRALARLASGADQPGQSIRADSASLFSPSLPERDHIVVADTQTAAGNTRLALLRLVRARGPISRAELARRLGVERSTITEIVRPLLELRGLRETESLVSRGAKGTGRPGVGLALNTGGQFFIGVNLGVRTSHVGAMTAGGRTLAEASFDTPGEATAALRLITEQIAALRAEIVDRNLAAVGFSVPGPTCVERRRLLYAPHLGWRDVAIADVLQTKQAEGQGRIDLADVPVIVENDSTAAALFEAATRLSEETGEAWRDFALVRAGTGIGVGLVLDGETYRGTGTSGGWAGEFGHMTIVANGKSCPCGNRGCWERYASASSAASLYTGDRAIDKNRTPKFVEIVARAEAGERRAVATLEQVGNYLGIGISNVILGLGVSRIIVSGRIVHAWKFMREPLQKAVGRTMAGRLAEWSVVAGKPTGAGLGGAVEVAVDHYLSGLGAKAVS